MDRLASMTSFVKVVDCGGFSAAARRLNLSVTMVSSHVQALEARLGARLLNRTTRKVALTDIGRSYYERCTRILQEIDEADQVAGALQSVPRGTLRLNTSPVLAPVLAPVIADYTRRYPETAVDLATSDRMVDLVEEGFDLALRMTPVPESSLIVRRITSYRFVVCGAPFYLAAHGTPTRPADLAQHNCLRYSFFPLGDQWRFHGPDGEHTVRIAGNLQCNSGETLRAAAVLGQGLVFTPDFLVAEELKAGRLVALLAEFLPMELAVNAIYPHRHHLSAKVRSFIDLLAARFRAQTGLRQASDPPAI